MPTVHKLALGVFLVSGAVTVAMAQPAAPPAETPPATDQTPAPGAPAPAAPGIDVRVGQRPTLSAQDMVTNANDYRRRMNEVMVRINSLIEQARKQKDIIKINCLTDKLVQLKASLNIVDRSFSTMQEASARADEGAAFHEYTRITIVHQNVQVLATEAEACVGEDLSYVGATRVDVDITGVPPGDPTQPGPPGGGEVVRPPEVDPPVSPFI
jgi:hypothetical protein